MSSSMSAAVLHRNIHAPDAHHCHDCREPESSTFLEVLGKVCMVALTAFAAWTNFLYFVPFFLLGIGIGIYNHFHESPANAQGRLVSPCSQGFLEQLSGVRLPALVALVANVATTVCHIDHHDTVFVPIVGVSVGAWAGKMAAEGASLLYKKFTHHPQPAHCHTTLCNIRR
jgi:hypothetical protein